jgi:hypothetical protein
MRTGKSGDLSLFFLLNAGASRDVTVAPLRCPGDRVVEWVTGTGITRDEDCSFRVHVPGPGFCVLQWHE